MARGRRGPGSRRGGRRSQPIDLQSTLSSLLRTTLEQVGVVRQAMERQARSSRERLDGVMLQRKRRDAFVRLGQFVYELAMTGALGELEEVPEIAELLDDIEHFEQELDAPDRPGWDDDVEAVSSADWRPPPRRDRPRRDSPAEEVRVWRPVMPETDDSHVDRGESEPSGRHGQDDQRREPRTRREPGYPDRDEHGERAGSEPRRRGPRQYVPGGTTDSPPRQESRASRFRRRRQRRAAEGGPERVAGIAFVTDHGENPDSDLADYMHEDDVPAKK